MAATADAWTIIVTALDRASVPFQHIHQAGIRMMEPLAGFGKTLGDIGEQSGLLALSEQAEGLERHFGGIEQAATGLAGNIGMLGGVASAAGLVELAKHSADYGDQLELAKEKTGFAIDELARLHYVAEQNEVSIEAMDKGLEYLNKNIAAAGSGQNKQALALFRAMHIHIRDGNGQLKTAATLWGELSEQFKSNSNIAQKTNAAQILLGRSGRELIPVLDLGIAKQGELGKRFDELHGKMTDAAGEDAKAAHEAWLNLGTAAGGLGDAIGMGLEPYLNPVIDGLTKFATENRNLAASLSGTALALAGVGLAARPVWELLKFTGSGLMFIGETALAVVAPLAEFVEGLWLGFSALEAFDLAAAANPFGLFVIGAAAIGAAAYEIYEHWEPIKDFFVGLWDYTAQAFHWAYDHILPWIPGGALVHMIVDNWSPIVDFFGRLWHGVVDWFEWAWEKIKPIVEPMIDAAEWMGGKIYNAGEWVTTHTIQTIGAVEQHGYDLTHPAVAGAPGTFDMMTAPDYGASGSFFAGSLPPMPEVPNEDRGGAASGFGREQQSFATERPVFALPPLSQPSSSSPLVPSLDDARLHVVVDFNNAPKGMRATPETTGPISYELNVGQAWDPDH